MKIEKDFAPVTIKIETKEEYQQIVKILTCAAQGDTCHTRDHAYHLLKLLKEA